MTTTRRDFLIEQYNLFSREVLEITKTRIVPSLDNVDLTDVLYFFQYQFGAEGDYDKIIRELIDYNNVKINDVELHLLYPIFLKYIAIFKSIC